MDEKKTKQCENLKLPVAAFAGNPNVGKSSVFNLLTGMHQHTGNWSGKTVGNAIGKLSGNKNEILVADLPGAYSINPESFEEETARDFIVFCRPELVVYVCAATSFERNLIMLMQICEFSSNVLLCVNMTDELEMSGARFDKTFAQACLGIKTVCVSAKKKRGIAELKNTIVEMTNKKSSAPRKLLYNESVESEISKICDELKGITTDIPHRAIAVRILLKDENFISAFCGVYTSLSETIMNISYKYKESDFSSAITETHIKRAEQIANECITSSCTSCMYENIQRRTDKLLTGKIMAFPVMFVLLLLVLWMTISGANYPSQLLTNFFSYIEPGFYRLLLNMSVPATIANVVVFGIWRVVAWIIAVMLPPMAIFFPLFTILEDSGYLPRIAFNLDRAFSSCGGCGKQALTMCMGFGCNAVGVSGARIISSERERLIAIVTNSFSVCNGRFPILIAIITMFAPFGTAFQKSLLLMFALCFSLGISFCVSKILSKTILSGKPSSFVLELPPYRMPKIGEVVFRSLIDRTLFVLARAVTIAAPAGLVIWLCANITVGGSSLLHIFSSFLDPFGRFIGLDGVILIGFILGFPANEIVIPIIMMAYMSGSELTEYRSVDQLFRLFTDNGWTTRTALCTCVFATMHWPCATTLATVYKETKSFFYTLLSLIVPTICGVAVCAVINLIL